MTTTSLKSDDNKCLSSTPGVQPERGCPLPGAGLSPGSVCCASACPACPSRSPEPSRAGLPGGEGQAHQQRGFATGTSQRHGANGREWLGASPLTAPWGLASNPRPRCPVQPKVGISPKDTPSGDSSAGLCFLDLSTEIPQGLVRPGLRPPTESGSGGGGARDCICDLSPGDVASSWAKVPALARRWPMPRGLRIWGACDPPGALSVIFAL